jgi:hypothetical protein
MDAATLTEGDAPSVSPVGVPNWWPKVFDFRSEIIPFVTRRSWQPDQTGRGHLAV